jgi:hypothetical protein
MKNNFQNKLQSYIDHFSMIGIEFIKWDEYVRLEPIYKNNFILNELNERASYMHKWMHNIGKEVYHSKRNFNYALVENFETDVDFFNKPYFDTSFSSILTQEMFDEFCLKYIKYQVERLTKELVEKIIVCNSTSKINNLVFEWNLECKQELIKIFKELSS